MVVEGGRRRDLTSCWEFAVNLRVDFFVSKAASYLFDGLPRDGYKQNQTLEGEINDIYATKKNIWS